GIGGEAFERSALVRGRAGPTRPLEPRRKDALLADFEINGDCSHRDKTYPKPMTALYHDAQRRLQDRFDTRRLADRIEERLVHDSLDEDDAAFITAADMFFLATVDPEGRPNCSYKGGDPGFVRVVDDRTLAFPNYDGNGMYLSMGNALATGEVGMLFIDFEKRHRMRVNGVASV